MKDKLWGFTCGNYFGFGGLGHNRMGHRGDCGASPMAQQVKNLPANAGDVGLIPRLGRSLEEGNGNSLQHSCLKISMDRGARGFQSIGPQRVGHNWVTEQRAEWSALTRQDLSHLPYALCRTCGYMPAFCLTIAILFCMLTFSNL